MSDEQLRAAQNAELDLRAENQRLREQLAHAAGFLEGMAHRCERWTYWEMQADTASFIKAAANCRALAESLRKAAGMTDQLT